MGTVKALFDTNILIDYLNGREEAFNEFLRYSRILVSRITWMEVLVGASTAEEEMVARDLLDLFEIVEMTPDVAEKAVGLRKERGLRLPDAIILASAHFRDCLLVTRDTKAFRAEWTEIRIPYSAQ